MAYLFLLFDSNPIRSSTFVHKEKLKYSSESDFYFNVKIGGNFSLSLRKRLLR